MSIVTLDPKTALIVVDLQKGITALPCVHPMADIVRNASMLAKAFREQRLPVVLVNVKGAAPGRTEQQRSSGELPADWAQFVPELEPQPQDHTVTKYTWGAFTNTDLGQHLEEHGVTQVVVCGVATSIGVESTARQAYELGFNVALAVDAMTDMNSAAHENSVKCIFPRLGETGSTQDIIKHLGA